MGTSQSSSGPAAGVPLVPPWASPEGEQNQSAEDDNAAKQEPLASTARFRGSRRSLGDFVSRGNLDSLKRGLGSYVRNGYGGSATASRRFSRTADTARGLFLALNSLAGRPEAAARAGIVLDRDVLRSQAANEVLDAVVDAVCPTDGTQDKEASRFAVYDALAELLKEFPNADLFSLSDEERRFAVERFVANDVFRRVELDVGKAVQDKAASLKDRLDRMRQIRDYVAQEVAASFKKVMENGQSLTAGTVQRIVADAVRATLEVFEEYAS